MLNLSITCHKSYYKLVAKLNFVNQDESQRLELKFNFARLPYAPTESVTPWNVPPYDNHFSHLIGSSYDNELISQSRFQSDETEEVAQASEMQSKGKGKAPYKKWTSEEQTFLIDLCMGRKTRAT